MRVVCVVTQVFVLSRMGNNTRALSVIIERQQDVPRAIEFVRRQADDELWENLIDWALQSPDTTGGLVLMLSSSCEVCRVCWCGGVSQCWVLESRCVIHYGSARV